MVLSMGKKIASGAMAVAIAAALAGCAGNTASASGDAGSAATSSAAIEAAGSASAASAESTGTDATRAASIEGAILDGAELFTNRDLAQEADTALATSIELASGQDVTISEEGVYVVSGTAENATIYVEADENAKVQIVLDGVTIVNETAPAIYVKSADKVFITTVGDNALSVTGAFATDGDANVDAVVFSKDDLVLNGTGSLAISSTANGITSKDDLKVTGGSYDVTATGHAFEANDSIAIADGDFTINAGKDGFNCESDEGELGYVYIGGGSFTIASQSDGIHASSVAQVDGGTLDISSAEGIEGTYVQVNGGEISIAAWDDGMNATSMSSAYAVTIEITGGDIDITMAQGDTDALDANGDLYISGGNVSISAQFAFDYDGTAALTGGTVYVNGEQVTEITESMTMGGMGGGQMGGGQMGGPMGGQMPDGEMPSGEAPNGQMGGQGMQGRPGMGGPGRR